MRRWYVALFAAVMVLHYLPVFVRFIEGLWLVAYWSLLVAAWLGITAYALRGDEQ